MKWGTTDWEELFQDGEGDPEEGSAVSLFDFSMDPDSIDREIRGWITNRTQADPAMCLEKIEDLTRRLWKCMSGRTACRLYEEISWQNREESSYLLQAQEPKGYSGYIWDYLCLAAEKEKEELFDLFLTKSCKINIWWEREAEDIIRFFPRKEDRWKEREGKLIHTGPVWLEKIIRKFGIQNEAFEKRLCYAPHLVETDAPRIYTAILAGDIELVKLYLSQGVELNQDDTEDCLLYADFSVHRFCPWYEWNPDKDTSVKCRHELGYAVRFSDRNICGPYGTQIFETLGYELLVHDPFTMAVLSQNKEMIQFIGDRIGALVWNENMEQSMVYANYEITELLLKKFPEIPDYIHLPAILQGKNTVLLKAFRKKGRDAIEEEIQEAKKFLRWYTREADSLMKEAVLWHHSSIAREFSFFKELLLGTRDQEFRELVIEFLYCEWILAEKSGRKGRERFIELLLMHPDYQGLDFTEIFFHMQDTGRFGDWLKGELYEELLAFMRPISQEKNFLRFGIDLYADRWKEVKINFARQGILFMKLFLPLQIRPKADVINQGIIKTGSSRMVRSAIRRGFITEKNAWALYQYTLDIGVPNEEILILLMELLQRQNLRKEARERMPYTG